MNTKHRQNLPKPSKPSLIFSSSMNLTQLNLIDPNHIKLNALLL
jgi:hypothetical protein